MPCYSPITGYRSQKPNENGKFPVVFQFRKGYYDFKISVPCGKCVGCKLDKARLWSIRCSHEAQMHRDNCVVTLTYDDVHLPFGGSLCKDDVRAFMKRLRSFVKRRLKISGLRFYLCGEYGERFKRPHFHILLFGFDFPDKILVCNRKGVRLFESKILDKLWGLGFANIGEVNDHSISYVSRYVLKKLYNSDSSVDMYEGLTPEFVLMSRRPGIGSTWFSKFESDVFPHDYVVLKGGAKLKPPRFYDEKFSLTNGNSFRKIKASRVYAQLNCPDNVPARLKVRHKLALLKIEHFKERRKYETSSV